jgi:hypothetical protein
MQYDANTNVIVYKFSANGVDNVECRFEAAGRVGEGEFVDVVDENSDNLGGQVPH